MKKICKNCGAEMKTGFGIKNISKDKSVSDLKLKDEVGIYGLDDEKIKVAVCTNCGEVSLYIDINK